MTVIVTKHPDLPRTVKLSIVPGSGWILCAMSDQTPVSPAKKRAARVAARKGDKVRRRAIEQAMLAGWSNEDADESNWLDEAARAHPGPEGAVHFLYGLTTRLVDRLAEATGEDRQQVLKDVLR